MELGYDFVNTSYELHDSMFFTGVSFDQNQEY